MKTQNGLFGQAVSRLASCVLSMTCSFAAFAGEVTAESAVNATSSWIARSTDPSRLPTGEVRTFSMNGTNAFHMVALSGGGWVALSADDASEPILAFSFEDDAALPDEDDGCPGWGFLAYCAGMDVLTSSNGDADGDEAFDDEHVCGSERPFFTITPSMTQSRPARKSLAAGSRGVLAVMTTTASESDDEQLDIRVPSFVKSRWNQSTAQSKYCYNYYTPEHAVCGCVATAMAQVMRYFEWPASNIVMPITNTQHRISYCKEAINTNFINGAFDWSKMPYNPGKKSDLTDEECEMIGRLTFDCGVSLGMNYGPSASAPIDANGGYSTRGGLKNDFGYGYGCYVGKVSDANIKNTLLPSLDAKRPASCSIPGHMVVADGYAFKGDELYIHLNMGWGGLSDAYYSAFGGSSKRRISAAHFNLTTNGTVRIASGRVTDQNGEPLSGVTVNAKILMSGETTPTSQTVMTDDYGIYAVATPSGMHSIDISAEKRGYDSLCESLTATTSSENDGNSWGNDFVLVARNDWYEWTGKGDGTTLGDARNWNRAIMPRNGAILVFGVATPSFVTNDIPEFAPASIEFLPECPKVVIGGLGFRGVDAMTSSSAERPVFASKVEFSDTINVSGAIEFKGGVQGTYPVNHDVYYGVYNLMATEWTLSSAITIAEGSSFLAQNTVIAETAAQLIRGEAGSHLKAKELIYHSIKGYAFGPFAGEAEIGKIDFDKKKWYGFNKDFTGTLRVGGIYFYSTPESGKEGDYLRFNSDGCFVIGSETGDSYLIGSRGTFNLREADAVQPLVLNCAADWDLIAVAPGAGAKYGHGFAIESQGVVIDTSDFDGEGTGHTVAVKKSGNPESVLKGAGYLAATGNGTLKFDTSCTFTGGLVASNGVTIALADGVTPGNGDLTMAGDTTLAIPDTANCTATVAGVFRISEDNDLPVKVCIGSGTNELAGGKYKILIVNGGFGEGVCADSFVLVNPTAADADVSFVLYGNELWLRVAVPGEYVWAGGNSGANWTGEEKWTFGGKSATWYELDGNTATFAANGDKAMVNAPVSVSRVTFDANATIDGTETVTVPNVAVGENVAASINAPTAGALEKSGEGTLTLGASRMEQTTIAEGTLAMAAGATLDPSKLTLGTDAAKPVALDYGGQTLAANPAAYLGAGMVVTLANGVFMNNADIVLNSATLPAFLTIANGASFGTTKRFGWNVDGEATVNVAGGTITSGYYSGNNWIMQDSRNGRLNINVTNGGLLEFGGETYMLTCRDGDDNYQSPELHMMVANSTVRVKNNKSLNLGRDANTRASATPKFTLAATKSVFDIGYGIYLGNNKSGLSTGGFYVADFDDCVITAKNFAVWNDRPLNNARLNGSRFVFNNDGAIESAGTDSNWITVGENGLVIDTNNKSGCLKANLGGEGAVMKAGAGKLTIAKSQTATGDLVCAGGETYLNAGLTLARPVTVLDGATFTVRQAATNYVANLTLEGGAAFKIDGYSVSSAPLAVDNISASASGKKISIALGSDTLATGIYQIMSVNRGSVTASQFELANSVAPNATVRFFFDEGKGRLTLQVSSVRYNPNQQVKLSNSKTVTLSAMQANWLNGVDETTDVDAALMGVSEDEVNSAGLLNLDITKPGWNDWSFTTTAIRTEGVADGKAKVSVTGRLVRAHAVKVEQGGELVDAPINGVARLYAINLATKEKTLVGTAEVDDATFANGDTATFTFETDAPQQFYVIEIAD